MCVVYLLTIVLSSSCNSFSVPKDVRYTLTLSQTKCVPNFFPRHTFMFLITNTNKPRLFQKKDILETLNKDV